MMRTNLVKFINQKKIDSEKQINDLCQNISENLENQILKVNINIIKNPNIFFYY